MIRLAVLAVLGWLLAAWLAWRGWVVAGEVMEAERLLEGRTLDERRRRPWPSWLAE